MKICCKLNYNSQTLKDFFLPYHVSEKPGLQRHERREYLWTLAPSRRPRLEWEAGQHCYSELA